MNKFAKYVPEADKKKQREHIGAMGMDDLFISKVSTNTLLDDGELRASFYIDSGATEGLYWIQNLDDTSIELIAGDSYTVIISDGVGYHNAKYENLIAYEKTFGGYYSLNIGADCDKDPSTWEVPFTFEVAYYVEDGETFREVSMAVRDASGTATEGMDAYFYVYLAHTGVSKILDPKYLPSGVGRRNTYYLERYGSSRYFICKDAYRTERVTIEDFEQISPSDIFVVDEYDDYKQFAFPVEFVVSELGGFSVTCMTFDTVNSGFKAIYGLSGDYVSGAPE